MADKPIDFTAAKRTKEFIETVNERNGELENALYQILDVTSLEAAKELAADVLGEDLAIYLEPELDFENDEIIFEGDDYDDDNNS